MKKILLSAVLLAVLAGAAHVYLTRFHGDRSASAPGLCSQHQVALSDCPFCNKSLIEKKGQCVEHGVPEALCTRCSPSLIPAFRAENDWCGGHDLPESQCLLCNPELADKSICPKHKIALADCPFCDKSLIEKKGHCGGHDVPEALCTRCNPSLIPAFKAENDWCGGHNLPESQCLLCNPELAEKKVCTEHQISASECPFCDPTLIKSKGQCAGHGVPEALCTRCNAVLIPAFKIEKDWCGGHNLPESQCLLCNPELAERKVCAIHQIAASECPFCDPTLIKSKGQCIGHGVPEALCTRCNSVLIPAFKVEGDWCAGHNLPESQCLICNPQLEEKADQPKRQTPAPAAIDVVSVEDLPRSQRPPAVQCTTHKLRVQFASASVARDAGLEFHEVERRPVTEVLECQAEVSYDGNRYARLCPRAPGVVRTVHKDLGDRVEEGDVLAVLDSAQVGAARARLLQAEALTALWAKHHARERRLLERQISAERTALEAETKLTESRIALSAATQELKNLGLTDEQIKAVSQERDTSSSLALRAPFAGVVVERSAVVGEMAGASRPLFAIADTSKMWAALDLYETDLAKIKLGQSVVLKVVGLRGEAFGGRITWISAHVDPRTRTLKARAVVTNSEGLLRANMFGTAQITIHDKRPVLVVPKAAVQWEGCCNVVFVKRSDTLYEPRKVRLGYETDRFYEVKSGVEPGETVVTQGSFLLKTEILKGSIGAGCCEVTPGK